MLQVQLWHLLLSLIHILGESWNSGRDYAAKILTGDPNMSGRRMSRGAHHLKRMGITTPDAEGLKNQMYDAQDFAAQTKDQYDRYNDCLLYTSRCV